MLRESEIRNIGSWEAVKRVYRQTKYNLLDCRAILSIQNINVVEKKGLKAQQRRK